jgi:hypothetical protein
MILAFQLSYYRLLLREEIEDRNLGSLTSKFGYIDKILKLGELQNL